MPLILSEYPTGGVDSRDILYGDTFATDSPSSGSLLRKQIRRILGKRVWAVYCIYSSVDYKAKVL